MVIDTVTKKLADFIGEESAETVTLIALVYAAIRLLAVAAVVGRQREVI